MIKINNLKKIILINAICIFSLSSCHQCQWWYKGEYKSHYKKKIEEFKNQNKDITYNQICFVGDSITEFWDLSLLTSISLIKYNRGISGTGVEGVLNAKKIIFIKPKPSLIVLNIGLNDVIAYYKNRESESFFQNRYRKLFNVFKSMNIPILIWGITPVIYNYEHYTDINLYIQNQNDFINELSIEYHFIYNTSIYSALFDSSTDGLRDEYTTDGGHLNELGYSTISPLMVDAINSIM